MLLHSLRALPLQLKVISPLPTHPKACPAASLYIYRPSPCTSSNLRALAFNMCRLHQSSPPKPSLHPKAFKVFGLCKSAMLDNQNLLGAHTSFTRGSGIWKMKNYAPAASESILFQVNPAIQKSKVKSMCLMFQYRCLNIFKEKESGDQVQPTILDAR